MSKRVKQYLMLLAALGVVAVALGGGGAGTFASFNAEVANQGNYFQTGTLFLHDTANGVTCTSESDTGNKNIGSGDACSTIFNATLASGTGTTYYKVALKNAGTLNASGISFYASTCQAASASTVTAAHLTQSETGTVLLLHISAPAYGIPTGTSITVGSETFQTAGQYDSSTGTIAVNSHAITGTLANNTNVVYAPSFGSGDLCGGLDVGIVETDSSQLIANAAGCAYGDNSTNPVCNLTSSYTLTNLPHSSVSPQGLQLTAGGGDNNAPTSSGLDAGGTRYFLIAVKPDSDFGNTYQNKKATVDITWHIDQA